MGWFRRYPQIWGSVLFVGVLTLGGWIYSSRRMKDRNENGPGVIEHVSAVTFSDGRSALLLSESIEHHDEDSSWHVWRLSVLAIADGTLRARAVLPDSLLCGPASQGLAWCTGHSYQGKDRNLELRNVDALTTVADAAKLRAAGPELAGWISNDTPTIDRNTGILYATAKDGHVVAIDPKTISATRSAVPTHNRKTFLGSTPDRGVFLNNDKAERIDTVSDGNGSRRQRLVIGNPRRPLGDRSFLSPDIVARLVDPKVIVVVHKTSLDEKETRLAFTCIAESGETKWSLEDANGSLITTAYAPEAGVIAFAIGSPAEYVLGVDVRSGVVRYRYDGSRKK